MSQKLTIRKGLDIKLEGAVVDKKPVVAPTPSICAVVPDDYVAFVPKPAVKEGDTVRRGDPLLYDKRDEEIKAVSPVAGVVKAIVRGERRKILRVEVAPAKDDIAAHFDTKVTDAEAAAMLLKRAGLWVMMRQRPYDIVPAPKSMPRDIFITAIDSAPLAVNPTNFYNDIDTLAAAVKLLSLLTKGNIYIGRRADSSLKDIPGATMVDVAGPHPAGNAGTLIANLAPVNKGEVVWTLDLSTLWRIGHLVLTGETDFTTYVAVTGSEVKQPQIVQTVAGADVSSILSDNINNDGTHRRIISGNVLTGVKVAFDGYLHYPFSQLTVIPEGDDVDEFMGWASLSFKKQSTSRTFPGHFFGKKFRPDARLLGGRRAFIMSGEYDKYMPMDIMAEYLLKAIIGRDIEKMEELGIYEVAPEDFALGEYADTSKIEAQKIVREGLEYLRKELE